MRGIGFLFNKLLCLSLIVLFVLSFGSSYAIVDEYCNYESDPFISDNDDYKSFFTWKQSDWIKYSEHVREKLNDSSNDFEKAVAFHNYRLPENEKYYNDKLSDVINKAKNHLHYLYNSPYEPEVLYIIKLSIYINSMYADTWKITFKYGNEIVTVETQDNSDDFSIRILDAHAVWFSPFVLDSYIDSCEEMSILLSSSSVVSSYHKHGLFLSKSNWQSVLLSNAASYYLAPSPSSYSIINSHFLWPYPSKAFYDTWFHIAYAFPYDDYSYYSLPKGDLFSENEAIVHATNFATSVLSDITNRRIITAFTYCYNSHGALLPVWIISYYNDDYSSCLQVRIDAKNGEIIYESLFDSLNEALGNQG